MRVKPVYENLAISQIVMSKCIDIPTLTGKATSVNIVVVIREDGAMLIYGAHSPRMPRIPKKVYNNSCVFKFKSKYIGISGIKFELLREGKGDDLELIIRPTIYRNTPADIAANAKSKKELLFNSLEIALIRSGRRLFLEEIKKLKELKKKEKEKV